MEISGRDEGNGGAVAIVGSGRALPARIIDNAELSVRLGITEAEIVKKTGILTRHWAEAQDKPSTLAIRAAQQALDAAGISAADLDLIIVSTTTPDMFFPSTATRVQVGLKARKIPAFDVNASCSGFLYALSIAEQYFKTGTVSTALVIATDLKSRFLDLDDVGTSILFGDGAGAVVLRPAKHGIVKSVLGADGAYSDLIYLPAGAAREALSEAVLREKRHTMQMDGKRLFRIAVRKITSSLTAFLKSAGLSVADIDFFIFHQANLRILEAVFKRMHIPPEKTELSLRHYGNTSSASLPITLDVALRKSRIKPGDKVVLSAFGGGITWGHMLFYW